jgi:hypothetical protein
MKTGRSTVRFARALSTRIFLGKNQRSDAKYANVKPKAIMIPTSEETYSSDLEMLDRVALSRAVEAIRADSVVNGTDALKMEQIDAEIASVRAARLRF